MLFSLATMLAGEVEAAAGSRLTGTGDGGNTVQPPDLTFSVPIKAGSDDYGQFKATVPGFSVSGAKFKPRASKTRLMIAVQFNSNSVRSARLEITLLKSYSNAEVIDRITHVEGLGPVQVFEGELGRVLVRKWDDWRALWFDLPPGAGTAEAIQVDVFLERLEDPEDVYQATGPLRIGIGEEIATKLECPAGDSQFMARVDSITFNMIGGALQAEVKGTYPSAPLTAWLVTVEVVRPGTDQALKKSSRIQNTGKISSFPATMPLELSVVLGAWSPARSDQFRVSIASTQPSTPVGP